MESIALALALCAILAILSKSFSLPPVPLYILAGAFMGNYGLLALQGGTLPQYLGHLGLIFLLLYSGLEFKPQRFLSRGPNFLISGLLDLNINMATGFLGALALGFSPVEAFIVGSAFFDTSSAVAISSLIENRKLVSPESETIIWLLIFEDLVMVLLIFIVSSEMQSPLFILLKLGAVVALLFSVIRLVRVRMIDAMQRADEVPVLFVFCLVLGSIAVSLYIGIPETALILILGSALSVTNPESLKRIVTPFKDVFLVVFFFFFGTTVHFAAGIALVPIVAFTAWALLSKMVSGLCIGRALHQTPWAGMEIGMNTLARGEFAVAIAAVYGSAPVSTAIASMVIVTSVVGAVASRKSRSIEDYLWRKGWISGDPPRTTAIEASTGATALKKI